MRWTYLEDKMSCWYPSLGKYGLKKEYLLKDTDGRLWLGFYNPNRGCWQDVYDNQIIAEIIAWKDLIEGKDDL